MRRRVVWSEAALDDLDATIDYIAERNPAAARRVLEEVHSAAAFLGRKPIGRAGRVPGTFEKTVSGRRYIIAYAIDPTPDTGERVVILRVIHTARNWPAGNWPE